MTIQRRYRLHDPTRNVTSSGREPDAIAPWLARAVHSTPGASDALLARQLGVQQIQVKAARQAGRHAR
jgi:hypothetical protein